MNTDKSPELQDAISFDDFMGVELRVGTVIEAAINQKAKKPAYVLSVDFGPYGIKTSSAQITRNYQPEDLVGKQVIAVMNFPVKRIAGVKSEVLVLGAYSESSDVVLLGPFMQFSYHLILFDPEFIDPVTDFLSSLTVFQLLHTRCRNPVHGV